MTVKQQSLFQQCWASAPTDGVAYALRKAFALSHDVSGFDRLLDRLNSLPSDVRPGRDTDIRAR